jgi:hypothetical protein
MSAQHTPGPWTVFDSETDGQTYGINGADGRAVVFYGATKYDGIRSRADARLIAAAPDLLAALRDIVSALGYEGHDGWYSEPVHSDDVKRALAAIVKATGSAA